MDHYVRLSYPAFAVLLIAMASCGNEKTITERIALAEVTHYLSSNPVYETADMEYGEVKFRKKSDSALLAAYQELEKGGYVTLELLKERKRFLSKDSTYVYLIKLTDKSIPFVLQKTDKKVSVKTFYYELEEDGGIHLEQTGKNRAKATVTLKKRETDFADFMTKNKDSNASFTKKTYTLRFQGDSGWGVTK